MMKTYSKSSPSESSAVFATPGKKDVARLAYEIWQRQGCPAGRDEMIWLEAERAVARGALASSAPKRKS